MNLEIFKNDNFEIRVAVGESGDPLFCLADVCKILELTNASVVKNAIASEFDDSLSLTYPIFDSLGREQNVTFITELQLYFVLMRSDKPNAKSFRKWVNVEVLPSIRKHGGYLTQKILVRCQGSRYDHKTSTRSKSSKSKNSGVRARKGGKFALYYLCQSRRSKRDEHQHRRLRKSAMRRQAHQGRTKTAL